MRDFDEMSEDEMVKAIESLAPPALPFGVVPPEEVGYFTSRVYGVFHDAGVSPPEEIVNGLVDMMCDEYLAYQAEMIEVVDRCREWTNLNRT